MTDSKDNDGKDALDALELEAKEFNKDAEIDRILHAFRLDAYSVLDLSPGVPASSIKARYRQRSLLIHPDKTTNPSAPDAFDRLAKAHTLLLDDKERERLDEAHADARMLVMRERKLTPDSAEVREPTAEFRRAWRAMVQTVLVDDEVRRRKQMKAKLAEEGREKRKEDEELESRKRKREWESKWEGSREERVGSWRDFVGAKGKVAKAQVDGAGESPGAAAGGGLKKVKKAKKLKVLG